MSNPQVVVKKRAEKALKEQVSELELRARYWKAQAEIRAYAVQADQLDEAYLAVLAKAENKSNQSIQEPSPIEENVSEETEVPVESTETV